MRKMMLGLAGLAAATILTGCATSQPVGALYTEVTLPADVGNTVGANKVGRAKCTSILTLVATGDASISAAMRAGGIKQIHHVDWYAKNILGVIGEYECVVYGE